MKSEYYLGEYIESYDGELVNVDIIREFNVGDDKYSVLRRNDGMEFVVEDYEGDNEYIWVSVGEDGDGDWCFGIDGDGNWKGWELEREWGGGGD